MNTKLIIKNAEKDFSENFNGYIDEIEILKMAEKLAKIYEIKEPFTLQIYRSFDGVNFVNAGKFIKNKKWGVLK